MRIQPFLRKVGAWVLPPLGYGLMRLFWYTSPKRFHIQGDLDAKQCVVVCWHGELLCSPQAYRKFRPNVKASGIISRHFDGEIIARILGFFGIRPLRGSSSKGAKQVLLEAFRALKSGDDLLVTPDGPRGPRHHISHGAVALATKADLPIIAVNYVPSSYWQLKSWDRFVIPKPFARLDFYVTVISVSGLAHDEAADKLRETMLMHTVR